MKQDRNEHIKSYYLKVKSASKELTKKEAFKDLLNRLYSHDKEIEKIIDAISAGAERTVINIPRKDKLHKGSADTLYNKIIIEFENNLKLSLNHAKKQLAGYLLGQFKSGKGYNFTLIVSDCISWKVFAPDVSQLDSLDLFNEDELILNEVESASFILNENNSEDFYYWIDRFLFKDEKQKATLQRIRDSFGHQSNLFIEVFCELAAQYKDLKKFKDIQVSFDQWNKFLSISYGSFDASENIFLIHTYLSVFSKILAYAIVSNDEFIDDKELKKIINGSIFNKYNILNFIDNDFFHWIGNDTNFRGMKRVFRLISQEISTFDFNDVDEDILKGVYQELIDLDTRHALGEYYTPDWLCERIVKEFDFKVTDRILDPACGSGSFLRAAIHRFKELNPQISIEQINNNIYGIDIHPLSVQIAKTTMLLAFGKEIKKLKKPIQINIILANTLLTPEGVENIFSDEFIMSIDKNKLWLNSKIFEDVQLFDDALELCDELAQQTKSKNNETRQAFEIILKSRNINKILNKKVIDSFYSIYKSLKSVKEKGRDSIWKFIVKNLYKPYFLNNKFDYVIGNPPWFTFSSIKNEEYQNQLGLLAEKFEVKPDRVANFPHLEIAAIFLSYCSSYFLKDDGQIAYVLPRSFFNADHHDNTRSGSAKGFRLKQIWDLADVSPLFRIPSCVFFAEKADLNRQIPDYGIEGISFIGKLPAHNCNLISAETKLKENAENWYFVKRGKTSALSNHIKKDQKKINPYKKIFKQGATIVPRAFYFVKIHQGMPQDFEDSVINVKTSDSLNGDAKPPWKGLSYEGLMEGNFLFRTALAKNIFPFGIYNPELVVLPILIETSKENEKKINLFAPEELMRQGYLYASRWFQDKENIWQGLRTERNKNISIEKYLNWQNKLTTQNLNKRYLVLYTASAKDANAVVIDRKIIDGDNNYKDLEFIVESVTYVFYTNDLEEAYYLTAILNSTAPNLLMKDFQAKGLFGPRHVHKKILDLYFPKFDKSKKAHIELANISITAHSKVSEFQNNLDKNKKIEGLYLGKIRLEIKKHLEKEMNEIDYLVKKIIQ